MNITRILFLIGPTLIMLWGCKNEPSISISEFSDRIKALKDPSSNERRCSIVDSAIAAYSDEAYFYFERAICKSYNSNDSGEIADLSRAIQLCKEKDCETYLWAHSIRGFRWMHQGKHEAAFDDFWEAAQPRLACAQSVSGRLSHYWNAGLVATHQLRFDLIESVMQGMMSIDSSSNMLKKLQAETYRLQDKTKEALLTYDFLLQDTSEQYDYDLWIGRARIQKSLGHDLDARKDLAIAKVLVDDHIQRTADSLAFSDVLAEILYLDGQYMAAMTICERFLPLGDPLHCSMLHYTHGETMQAMGNLAQACIDWEKSAALGWGEAQRNLGQYCNR